MTADLFDLRYDQLYDRLSQVLSALPVIEGRRDDVGDVAGYLCSIYWSRPDDFAPDLTKQDERDLRALWKRVNELRLHINFKMSGNARVAMKIDNACQHQLGRMEVTAEQASWNGWVLISPEGHPSGAPTRSPRPLPEGFGGSPGCIRRCALIPKGSPTGRSSIF